ncbi:MAG: hypothetical protein V1697_01810 [Candidatus Levyibacteriota bacterium]
MKKSKLILIAFLQALALSIYCGLVATLIWSGDKMFGEITDFRGPLLFLILFVTSVLISALLTLSYPFILFWQKKKPAEALRVIIYTAFFLALFTLLAIFLLVK